jgi:tRNA(adenine34) deaminase
MINYMEHEYFMRQALNEAGKAFKKDEVPVGAVIVKDNVIIARAHNLIRSNNDPCGHAEVLAIKKCAAKLKNERLIGTILYVNIEPCAMCSGAIILARIKTLVYGAKDLKTGACGSVHAIIQHPCNNHKVELVAGVLEEESGEILKKFFREKRKLKK